MTRRPVRLVVPVVATACLLLAGCGLDLGERSAHGEDTSSATAPDLADVEVLDDPRSWEGPTSAVIEDVGIDPVAEDPTPELPVTLTDAQGTEVTVTDTSRVLALDIYGTLSRTVYDLGLGDSLVGRDISTQFAEAQDLPLVTQAGHDLNAEAILELDPTLIITDTSLGPWDVVLQMREVGIPVVVVDSTRSLENIASLTREIAAAVGLPAEGELLAERSQEQVDAVLAKIADVAPAAETDKLRAVFLYVRGQSGVYYMFGEGSGSEALLEALGLYDVSQEIGWKGSKPVTDEGLIAAQPDVIVMMTEGLKSAGGVDGLLERLPALGQTPAGQKERFVDMSDAHVLGFGPIAPAVLNALAVAIYAPEAVS